MQIHNIILGDYQTNSYCVTANEDAADCLVIDTGLSPQPLIDFIKEKNLNPIAVILTHGHADHIAGLNLLRENWPDIKVAIHVQDADMLNDTQANLSALTGASFETEPADIIIEEDGPIEFAGIKFDVMHTPGHTQGGICLYAKDDGILFAGDTLFAMSIGRTDFPGGNYAQLISGIKKKLLVLPDETKVYTGHGPETTIGTEKKFNQYLR
ncbi:MAG TPA: MBL fold metallo-hydrolase [Phycisphaerales bacterium]|nr:MBL fold metallo-hydrolase [Phycisphaerales bacterium]